MPCTSRDYPLQGGPKSSSYFAYNEWEARQKICALKITRSVNIEINLYIMGINLIFVIFYHRPINKWLCCKNMLYLAYKFCKKNRDLKQIDLCE